jgi:hypothetical protein
VAINKRDIEIVRGDDHEETLTFKDETTKVPIPVSGWTFAGQVRESEDSAAVVATFGFDTSAGEDGEVVMSLASADTAAMSKPFYFYDVEITIAGKKRTWLLGRILITKDTTRAS